MEVSTSQTILQGLQKISFYEFTLNLSVFRAAQFGKSFISASTQDGSARDDLKNACKYLRVINALRLYQVGVPLTLAQFHRLSPRVVIDRLLARRLFPLAQEISNWLELPPKQGVNRVLQHWAR